MVNEGRRLDGLIDGDCIGLQLIYRDDPLTAAASLCWRDRPSGGGHRCVPSRPLFVSAQADMDEYSEAAVWLG